MAWKEDAVLGGNETSGVAEVCLELPDLQKSAASGSIVGTMSELIFSSSSVFVADVFRNVSAERSGHADHFDIVERVEMGQMASMFFNKGNVLRASSFSLAPSSSSSSSTNGIIPHLRCSVLINKGRLLAL